MGIEERSAMTEVKVSGDTGDINGKSQGKPSLGELLGSFQVNDCLVKLIHQFLLYNEFESTADSLVHEAPKLGFDVLSEHLCTKHAIPKDVCKAIMSHYLAGDWRNFFNLWDNLIPQSIRDTPEYKILTFKLHVHFAILPLRIKRLDIQGDESLDHLSKSQTLKILQNAAETYSLGKEGDDDRLKKSMSEAMEQLKLYMATDGRECEEKSELVYLFALPSMNEAQTYATFPKLFQISWMEELTRSVQVFLMNRKQVRLTASQKTSTETITTASRPYVCVQGNVVNVPLTCENLKDFEDKLFRMNTAGKIPMTGNDLPKIPLEITRSTVMGLIPQHSVDDHAEIVPDDRNIPIFRDLVQKADNRISYCSKHPSHEIHSKSAQTRISTVTTTTNFISTGDLCRPATILNSSTLEKSTKVSTETNQELALAKSHLCNVQSNYKKLKIRFYELHSDYHKLIGVAKEMTEALENSVRGNVVDLQTMLESCISIFPDLFNHNIRGNTSETKALLDQEVEFKPTDLTAASHLELNINPIPPKLLDYKKIKIHLINGSVKTKLLLLQALRWKITLSQPGDRDETVNEYLRGDLLGLHAQVACDSGKSILPYLMMPKDVATPHPLQQSAARLINTLASLRCGRDYLSVGSTLLTLIVECLNGTNEEFIDAFTCDMIIAMLQKMSLRKQQRLYMIEYGLLEWLISHLRTESRRMRSYRLQYATALLMNLSLHKEAQIRASAMAPVVITTLTTLLSTDHAPALPFVNGSLNSFLLNQAINEEAKKSGLTGVLEYHRERNSGEIRKHLDHILKIHNRDYTNKTEDYETADDENEELDVLEDELEEGDPVKVHSGELSGEALLASCYAVVQNTSHIESPPVVEARPKTPRMHSRTNSMKSLSKRNSPSIKNRHNDLQTPTRDVGLSPRLIPQDLNTSRRKGKKSIALKPVATSPVRSLLLINIPPSITRLSPDNKQERRMVGKATGLDYPFVSETGNGSLSDSISTVSVTTGATNSEERIDQRSDKSRTSTCSPYFCSFTRTYEPNDPSDKSIQPKFKSVESGEPEDICEARKTDKLSRSSGKGRSKASSSPLERREKMMKSVRLNYSEESDNSEAALCLYANESSKGSSKTTVASSAMNVRTTCSSPLAAETEKLSSIASLEGGIVDRPQKPDPVQKEDGDMDKDVDAFLAKPKISRTPPQSAHPHLRTVSTPNKINSRRISTK